ncbi:hypothetical protein Leryth_018100 [Lithospermum erythrorhizon]|nr:hypothetical protein Leryth_018100 [Lithospermum erythrorhizon]
MQFTSLFTLGAGHVNPSKENDLGLVYDIHSEDYISYLCIELISGNKNYSRRVTKVGGANSTYDIKIDDFPLVLVDISPLKLVFTRMN